MSAGVLGIIRAAGIFSPITDCILVVDQPAAIETKTGALPV
jgi:hypothetical protein